MIYIIQIIGPKKKKGNSTYEFDAHLAGGQEANRDNCQA
jgi:hypothetical protein